MAAGTISQIKVLSKFNIPGGGKTLTGGAANQKTLVTGEITGSYLSTGGLGLNAKGGPFAFGLKTIDFIKFDVKSVNAATNADESLYNATYNHSTGDIHVALDGTTKPTDAHICVIKFLAIGDSSSPEFA